MAITETIKKVLGFGVEEKALTLTDPDTFALFGTIPTSSGVSVGPTNALRVPAVACAVSLISETIGALPAKLYNRADKVVSQDHPAHRLIHDEANEWTSAAQLRTDLTCDALLHGAGYAIVTRLENGNPYELHRIEPGKVARNYEPDGEPFYLVSTDNGQVKYGYRDILCIQSFGGVSPIKLARDAIALAIAFESHIGSIFANGGKPSGMLKSPKKMDVKVIKRLLASFANSHNGKNAGSTGFLDEGMEYQQLSMTLVDTQFAESRLEQIREIARAFRIPAPMIGELSRATWSNLEQLNRQFLQMTLSPWLKQWAWAYACTLLTPEERADHFVEFITADLLTTDAAARATSYAQYRSMGVMTANEVRAGLNLPSHSDGNDLQNPYTSSTTTTAPVAVNKDKTA